MKIIGLFTLLLFTTLGVLSIDSFHLAAQDEGEDEEQLVPKTRPTAGDLGIVVVPEPDLQIENAIPEFSDDPLPAKILPFASPYDIPVEEEPELTEGNLSVAARLTERGKLITQGLIWRIYSTKPNDEGLLTLISKSEEGEANFQLKPGQYLVHATYGFATSMQQVAISKPNQSSVFNINAGGVRLDAVVNDSDPLSHENVRFDIYSMDYDETGERKLIVRDVQKGQIVSLNAETYHVVSRYGNVNAVVRADIQIQPGKLVEATVKHSAAEVTLKLVNELGGEALVGTVWSILSPGGDIVVEGVGAFPTYVLAAGEYEVVAKYRGENYSDKFEVEPGFDEEVEVLAQN